MKLRHSLTALALLLSPLAAQTSLIPDGMSYQGFLTDNNGAAIGATTAVNRTLEFRLYKAPNGGNPIWGEKQTVSVLNGNFSVILGNGLALNGGLASGGDGLVNAIQNSSDDKFYFAIAIEGDPEFSPRQQLLPGAFAYRAKVAETANKLKTNQSFQVSNQNVLEFGAGRVKQTDAGKIGYTVFSDGLDLVGAGTNGGNRRITLWAEGGTNVVSTYFDKLNNHGTWFRSFGGGHELGTRDQVTYLKGPRVELEGETRLSQNLRIRNKNHIEFGLGENKQVDNGKVGYQLFSDGLDIVGAGSLVTNRKIHLHAQGGTTVHGDIDAQDDLDFSNKNAQRIHLWDEAYGIGIQDSSQYYRSGAHHRWFRGGSHVSTGGNAGPGGIQTMHLDTDGNLFTAGDINVANNHHLQIWEWRIRQNSGDSSLSFYSFDYGRNRHVFRFKMTPNGAVSTSDRRLKKNIAPLSNNLAMVRQLEPKTFNFKSDPEGAPTSYGFIAQEVQEILPDLVSEADNGKQLTLSYTGFIPIAVGAIKEQQTQIAALEAKVAELEAEKASWEARLSALEAHLNLPVSE